MIGDGIVAVVVAVVATALMIGLSGESLPSNPCDMISATLFGTSAAAQEDFTSFHGILQAGILTGHSPTR